MFSNGEDSVDDEIVISGMSGNYKEFCEVIFKLITIILCLSSI